MGEVIAAKNFMVLNVFVFAKPAWFWLLIPGLLMYDLSIGNC